MKSYRRVFSRGWLHKDPIMTRRDGASNDVPTRVYIRAKKSYIRGRGVQNKKRKDKGEIEIKGGRKGASRQRGADEGEN